ncbi:N-acetylmuramoyl-L-alanine amidase [Nocardia suismassiliense]|uniref:N-acetylmuramoyl-L-alanine amidase n=1 Tax=Nocardia suismassiliense TaxID=2077092 RepID=UPI00389928EA
MSIYQAFFAKSGIVRAGLGSAVTAAVTVTLSGVVPGTATATPAQSEAATKLVGKTVFVDPGHQGSGHGENVARQVSDGRGGMKDCQTTGMTTVHGVPEHTINWNVAQLVKTSLEQLGAQVVLSRQDDVGWGGCIDDRARAANESGAAVAVSIHADSAPADQRGFHLIVPELPIPDPTINHIQSSAGLAASTAMRDAYLQAGFVPATYASPHGLQSRRDIAGPALTAVPDVFIEMGNGANAEDAALLESQEGQLRHAVAITTGLVSYLLGPQSVTPNVVGEQPAAAPVPQPAVGVPAPQPASAEPAPHTAPDSQVEAVPQTASDLQAQAVPQVALDPQARAVPQAVPDPQARAVPQAAPNLQAQAVPQVALDPQAQAVPQAALDPQAQAAPEAAPNLQAHAVPQVALDPQAQAVPHAVPDPQAQAVPPMQTAPQELALPPADSPLEPSPASIEPQLASNPPQLQPHPASTEPPAQSAPVPQAQPNSPQLQPHPASTEPPAQSAPGPQAAPQPNSTQLQPYPASTEPPAQSAPGPQAAPQPNSPQWQPSPASIDPPAQSAPAPQAQTAPQGQSSPFTPGPGTQQSPTAPGTQQSPTAPGTQQNPSLPGTKPPVDESTDMSAVRAIMDMVLTMLMPLAKALGVDNNMVTAELINLAYALAAKFIAPAK